MVEDVAMFARNFSCVKVSKDSVIVFDSAMIIYIILFFNCMLRERDVIVIFFFFFFCTLKCRNYRGARTGGSLNRSLKNVAHS